MTSVTIKPEDEKEQKLKKLASLQRFGRVTLTIFVFETPLAALLHLIPNMIFPGWDARLGLVLLFALVNVALWWLALGVWEKIGYKGSLEWTIAKLGKLLSGKSSDKLKTDPVVART